VPVPQQEPALSAVLRERTRAAHAGAERSPYLTALVEGRVTRAGLAALLVRLTPVYEALERAGERWAGDVRVGRFVRPELHRSARLRADLVCLTGTADIAASPSAEAYTSRLEEVAQTSAAGFLAHHHTRCLADLSGGQVIRVALERSLGIDDGSGASFFAFPGAGPGVLKAEYRRCLDEVPFTAAEREELVGEALVAYRLNVALVADLDADLGRWTTG
jgi:heme oxygenase